MTAVSTASPDYQVIDENLRVAMRFFGEATGRGSVTPLPGVDAIYAGMDYGVFNIALLNGPLGRVGLGKRIEDCARHYAPLTKRWSFWLCDSWLDSEQRSRANQLFSEQGLRAITQPPGMSAAGLRGSARAIPELEFRPVSNAATRANFATITGVCFDIPYDISSAVYKNEHGWKETYRGYLGIVHGVAVSIISIVAAGGALGIYSLATLPQYRRKGYGEALLRYAVARERERTGLERLVLQSTEAGHSLYKRLGFRDVTKYTVYLTR